MNAPGNAHTQGIELSWAMLRRAIDWTFHHWTIQHLVRDVDEFAARAPMRETDTEAIIAEMFPNGIGRRLT